MLLLASILLFQRPKTPQKDNQVQLRPMNGVIFRRLSTFFDTFANHVPRFIRITFVDCLPCYRYITNSYIDWEKCLMVSKIDAIHRTQLHLIIFIRGFWSLKQKYQCQKQHSKCVLDWLISAEKVICMFCSCMNYFLVEYLVHLLGPLNPKIFLRYCSRLKRT